jgi:hypothetical protein
VSLSDLAQRVTKSKIAFQVIGELNSGERRAMCATLAALKPSVSKPDRKGL